MVYKNKITSARKMLKLFAFVALVAYASGFVVCPQNVCMMVRCAGVTAETCNGRIVQGGAMCGCCDACVAELGEGDSCMATFLLGVPASATCGQGLRCDSHTSTCVRDSVRRQTLGPCAAELQSVNNRLMEAEQHGMPLLGLERPNCDADGYYAGKQVSGSQAFCVDKNGTAIGSYMVNRWEADGMDCQCARDMKAYMDSGLIGKLFHCDARGNYATTQCMGSVCYCVDKDGNQVGTSTIDISQLGKLNC